MHPLNTQSRRATPHDAQRFGFPITAVVSAAAALATLGAQAQTDIVRMPFDDPAGTPIASFDLDGIEGFETPSAADTSGNGNRFLGFANSSGVTQPGQRLDAVTTTGDGLLSVAHASNTLDNGRMRLSTPVNGLPGGFETATATLVIHSWDFSTPLGIGNDAEQIRFGFGHESATNASAQVQITRDLFGGLLLRADTAGNGDNTGIDPVEQDAPTLISSDAVNNTPLSISVTLDAVASTFRVDYQFLDGVSPPVPLFTDGIPGDIRLDPDCAGGCPGPFDPSGKRAGYHLRFAFDGDFSDDVFLIDELFVTGTGLDAEPTLVGDLNGDGFVGAGDLDILLGVWNQTLADSVADLNDDGFIGAGDLDLLLGNWNAGTPAASAVAVPEPAGLTVLALGGAAALRRRR